MRTDVRQPWSVRELATALGVSLSTLWEAVWRNEVISVRIGKRVLIPDREARRLLDGPTREPAVESGNDH